MEDQAKHGKRNRNLWRNLLYLWTAAIALILHRATGLGVVSAIVTGFLIATALVWIGYLLTARRDRQGPPPPADRPNSP
jgi:hypothetical protein